MDSEFIITVIGMTASTGISIAILGYIIDMRDKLSTLTQRIEDCPTCNRSRLR